MNFAAHPDPGAMPLGPAAPFRLTPDLKYVFLSRCHAAAATALDDALAAGQRLIALAGEPGTGKTTLLTRLRTDTRHADSMIVYCPYPALSIGALLQDFLGTADAPAEEQPESPDAVAKRIAERHRGRRLILIVDDATRSPPRLLTDLRRVADELAKKSLTLQAVLATSPMFGREVDRILAAAEMPAAAHVELPSMDVEDVAAYVRHRMTVAGLSGDLFSTDALAEIAQYSLGVARVVNQICSRALMLSDWRRERPILRRLVVEAITDCPIDALVAPRTDETPFEATQAAEPVAVLPPEPDAPAPIADIPPAPEPMAAALPESEAPAPVAEIPPTVESVPEIFSSAEIDVPPPPSTAGPAVEPAPAAEPPAPVAAAADAVVLRPAGRDSWALRETARRRGRLRGDPLRSQDDRQQAPRFSGFVVRREAVPAAKSIPSPGPIAPELTLARTPKHRVLTAGALAVVVIGVAIFALRAELAGPVERFVPPEIRHQAAQLAEQAGAALDSLLRSLRSAYNL